MLFDGDRGRTQNGYSQRGCPFKLVNMRACHRGYLQRFVIKTLSSGPLRCQSPQGNSRLALWPAHILEPDFGLLACRANVSAKLCPAGGNIPLAIKTFYEALWGISISFYLI